MGSDAVMAVEDLQHDWFQPLNWTELDDLPPVEPVIPGLLNKGESGSLVAPGGAGKSLLALDVAVSLAAGTSVLGSPTKDPVSVLYVDMENPREEVAGRLRALGIHLPDLADTPLLYLSYPDLAPLDTPEGGRMLAAAAAFHEPALIVLDTISRLVDGKEDSADTWRNLYNCTMLPLRRQGRTLLRLDHQGHDTAKGARGSSAKRDDVDVAWIMKRTGDDIQLKLDKGRGLGHPEKIVLRRHTKPLRHVRVGAVTKADECVEAMNKLAIPLDASRDDTADLLREGGYKFSNSVIGVARIARRPSPS